MKKENTVVKVLNIILLVIGMAGFFFRPINDLDVLKLVPDSTACVIQIAGAVLIMAALGIMGVSMGSDEKNDEAVISEEDKRDELIRNKAAQVSSLVYSYLLLALVMVFIILGYSTPATMLGIVVLIEIVFRRAAVRYYNKKIK